MPIALLIPEYFFWHYTSAPKLALNIATNFLWFTYHFFSIPVLARTLFEPWHGMHNQHYTEIFQPNAASEKFLIKSLMRVVGFCVRSVVLLFGVVFCLFTAVVGLVGFLIWFVLPLAVVVLVVQALSYIL